MIKGLAITPPVIGRISIGHLVQKGEKWIPEKDDSFTLTTQVQGRNGWVLHPLHQQYSEQAANGKLRAIPVRLLFNDSELNLRAEYSAFDRSSGRPVCVGNGETARRVTADGLEEMACPGPDRCPFAKQAGCKLYGRLNVQIDGQQDELGSFIFRTTGYNSVRTLAARLRYFEAVSGQTTRYLPLLLRLRAKEHHALSYRTPVYYVDLTLRDDSTLAQACKPPGRKPSVSKRLGSIPRHWRPWLGRCWAMVSLRRPRKIFRRCWRSSTPRQKRKTHRLRPAT